MSARRRRRLNILRYAPYESYRLEGNYSSVFLARLSEFFWGLSSSGISSKLDCAYLLGLRTLSDSLQNIIHPGFRIVAFSGFVEGRGAVAPWGITTGFVPGIAGVKANRFSHSFGAYLSTVNNGRNPNLFRASGTPRCYLEINPGVANAEWTSLVNSDAIYQISRTQLINNILSVNRATNGSANLRLSGSPLAVDGRNTAGSFDGVGLSSSGSVAGNSISFLYGGSYLSDDEELLLRDYLRRLFAP